MEQRLHVQKLIACGDNSTDSYIQLDVAGLGAFCSAGLGCPKPGKVVPVAAFEADIAAAPPNSPPLGADVVLELTFPKRPPPRVGAAGVPEVVLALEPAFPKLPKKPPVGPVPPAGAAGGVFPKSPPLGWAASGQYPERNIGRDDTLVEVFVPPNRLSLVLEALC